MNNVLGSFWNPYSYFDYEEECRNHTWNGGWVFIGSNHDKIYITTNGSVEQKEGTDELGSEENPFSLTAYNEMFGNHAWIGGYVQEEDDCVYYPPQEDESGCGCGCGEGCGCGCGSGGPGTGLLIAGEAEYHPDVFTVNTYLEISWEDGSFLLGGQPALSVTLINEDNLDISDFQYSWENFYRIIISFYITLPEHTDKEYCIYEYNIPSQYRR